MLRLFLTLSILLAFPSLSNAHYLPGCGEDHSKLSMKTHAQQFAEDLSAPRNQRIKAMECLIFYGRRGVRILSRVLERELNNSSPMSYYVLRALAQIQDRSVMEPMLRLLDDESRDSQQSRADWNSNFSRKIRAALKEEAVEILAELAFSSLDEPNLPYYNEETFKILAELASISLDEPNLLPTTEEAITGWTGRFVSDSKRYYYEGERLRRYDIIRITQVLKKIAESEPRDTTERTKRVIQAASEGLERIEKRKALLKKHGPSRIFSLVYFDAVDTLDFHCPPPAGDRLSFCYRRGEGTIVQPSFAQTQIKSSNNILPFSLSEFRELPSDSRPFCRNPFHNP